MVVIWTVVAGGLVVVVGAVVVVDVVVVDGVDVVVGVVGSCGIGGGSGSAAIRCVSSILLDPRATTAKEEMVMATIAALEVRDIEVLSFSVRERAALHEGGT
jgi:hypothetical protein